MGARTDHVMNTGADAASLTLKHPPEDYSHERLLSRAISDAASRLLVLRVNQSYLHRSGKGKVRARYEFHKLLLQQLCQSSVLLETAPAI